MVHRAKHPKGTVRIALVGKYVALHDAYLSVVEALTHGGIENDVKVEVQWVDSETVTDENVVRVLAEADGVLVPGGFGDRGIEGKISAVRYAREHKVPFLGICLGMQMAVVEYARHVCGWADAHSSELDPATAHPVIDLMPDQRGVTAKGGTMRLGSYPCRVTSRETQDRTRPTARDEIAGATPPPLRVQQRLPAGPDGGGDWCWPGCPRTSGWWRSWNWRTTPGSWGSSSTRS